MLGVSLDRLSRFAGVLAGAIRNLAGVVLIGVGFRLLLSL